MSAALIADVPPRLRSTVDIVRIDGPGSGLVCLYDRQDPSGGQVVVNEPGLLLASLLDGRRDVHALRTAFVVRSGLQIDERQVSELVRQLDAAYLLDSERYHTRFQESVAAFRAAPTRANAHAGRAYPEEPGELRTFLDACHSGEGGPGDWPARPWGSSPRALVAPHIDLHRGGRSYAWGYRELAKREPAELYILLGTCHTPMSKPFAATAKAYETPLGAAPVDADFLERLSRRAPFDIWADEYSHRTEHALEFQALYLRFLGYAGGVDGAPIVPILCVPPEGLPDSATPREAAEVGDFLAALIETMAQDGRRVCFVAGADFAHVGPQFGDPGAVDDRMARHVGARDRAMLELIANGDADGFYRQVVDEEAGPGMAEPGRARAVGGPRRICGLAPIYALLALLGPSEGQVVHYDQWIEAAGAGSVTFGCVLFP